MRDTIAADWTFGAEADTAGDASSIADAQPDADAPSCRLSTGSDAAQPDAAGPGTITDLMGYTASDVLYVTWSGQAGAIPRNRHLELRFDPSTGVCAVSRAGQLKANGSQLRIYLLRANFLMFGTLPSFFVPGTYPLNENVYEQDAGIASVADVDLVTMDSSCHETFVRATAGDVTLTSVTPGHVAGSFTATFDDAGTVSGRFDVDLRSTPSFPIALTAHGAGS
jgi:hypothetical protein